MINFARSGAKVFTERAAEWGMDLSRWAKSFGMGVIAFMGWCFSLNWLDFICIEPSECVSHCKRI